MDTCLKPERQAILAECKAAVAEYCCCDMNEMNQYPYVYDLDWVDMYEVCLDVAKRVKGEKALAWEEFLVYRDCILSA